VQERTAELTERNEELIKSKELYRSVVQDHLEFIVRWLPNGTYTFVGESYCKHRGISADALLATSFFSAILDEDRDGLEQKLSEISVSNPVMEHVHRVVNPDGRFG